MLLFRQRLRSLSNSEHQSSLASKVEDVEVTEVSPLILPASPERNSSSVITITPPREEPEVEDIVSETLRVRFVYWILLLQVCAPEFSFVPVSNAF